MAVAGETSDPHPEINIPGLTILKEVGEGGFGIVYLGSQSGTYSRKVAIKVLKPGLDTRQILRRFEIEQKALTHLEHPNIAQIYQSGETEKGYPYFTMEYIEGFPITEYFAGENLRKILETYLHVCDGISHAHDRGLIHRDLKPSNILVTDTGIPKVIDFGIAKATDPESAPGMTLFTGNETWLGTPAYMAPEQAMAGSLEVDERSDIYSLGVILYEMISGETPLESATGRSRREDLATHKVPSLRKIDPSLEGIILKALSKNPADRYPDVSSFAADLRRYLAGDTVHAGKRQKRIWPWLIATALTITTVAMLWPFSNQSEITPPDKNQKVFVHHPSPGRAVSPIFNQDGSRVYATFFNGGRWIMADPLTGEELVSLADVQTNARVINYNSRGDSFVIGYMNGIVKRYDSETASLLAEIDVTPEGEERCIAAIEVRLPDEDEDTLITVTGKGTSVKAWQHETEQWSLDLPGPLWSMLLNQKGTRAFCGCGDGHMVLIDLEKRTILKESKLQRSSTTGYRLFPDGSGFAMSYRSGLVAAWDWEGREKFATKVSQFCHSISISPDSLTLATGNNDGVIRILDTSSGEVIQQLYTSAGVWTIDHSPDGKILVGGCLDGVVRFWNTQTGKPWRADWNVGEKVWGARFVPHLKNGHMLVTTTSHSGMRIVTIDDLPE